MKIAPTIQTRVTGLHFDTGDRIGLSIAKGSETYVQNVLMTYDGTAFTAPDLLWYNDSNEKSTHGLPSLLRAGNARGVFRYVGSNLGSRIV